MRSRLELLLVLVSLPFVAGGATRHASLQVSVTVAPDVRLDATAAPATFDLGKSDLTRGFKDVEARYRVDSNVPRGYWLRFDLRPGLVRAIEVHGLGGEPMTLGPLGGEVRRAAPGPQGGNIALRFRLRVGPELAPGRYPMPVAVSAGPA
jgi:hypothetical protein